ncbi:MAG: organic solvent tolerance protein OstA [Bacteroidia bacterium]|nr:organic solvent tolerance protein OstA [Bacteroidia bacterium]
MQKRIQFFGTLVFLLLHLGIKAQESSKIEILHANSLEYDESVVGKTKRLIGDVKLLHEGAIMYCDSAWMNQETNTVQAFNRIHIEQGDTLDLYGDKLDYDGNTKKAIVTGKVVKLIDKDITLTTTIIHYDRNTGIANYQNGGKIVDKKSTLTSELGYYYSSTKDFYYRKNVKVVNKDYTILCDTLRFNTKTEISYFLGPTHIVTKDSSKIYCEYGWNDTKRELSRFEKNTRIISDKQEMLADAILYDEKIKKGLAYCYVQIIDTANQTNILGDFAEYFQAYDRTMMTDNALLVQYDKKDTLFLHADTLRSFTPDTTKDQRMIKAYYKVRFYKSDIQGTCDSLSYFQGDSLMRMYGAPVLWSDSNQITADTLYLKMHEGKVSDLYLRNNSFIISREDSVNFNQIKGRFMHAFLRENKLYKVRVEGNSETLYYAKESDGNDIGVNKAESSDMLIWVQENKVQKITFITKPTAILHPMKEMNPETRKLKDFKWYEEKRPKDRKDIFDWR